MTSSARRMADRLPPEVMLPDAIGLATVLARLGSTNEAITMLRYMTGQGNQHALVRLAEVLRDRDVLRRAAATDSSEAGSQWADLLARRGDVTGLQALVDGGNPPPSIDWPTRCNPDTTSMVRSGCQRSLLPADFPPASAVKYHFYRWCDDGLDAAIQKILRAQVRAKAGRCEDPSAVVLDTQSVHAAVNVPAR